MESISKIKKEASIKTYIEQKNDYLYKLNEIVEFINITVAEDKNNPFTGCKLYNISDPEEMYKWEVYVTNNGKIPTNKYSKWHEKFIKQLYDYAEEKEYMDVVEDMVFLI